jgi:predicted porin
MVSPVLTQRTNLVGADSLVLSHLHDGARIIFNRNSFGSNHRVRSAWIHVLSYRSAQQRSRLVCVIRVFSDESHARLLSVNHADGMVSWGKKGQPMSIGHSRIQIHTSILRAGIASSALLLVLAAGGTANAQSANDEQVKALQAQIDQLQKAVNQLKSQQATQAKQQQTQQVKQTEQVKKLEELQQQTQQQTVVANVPYPVKGPAPCFFQLKPGKTVTFCTPGGEATLYGNFDVSLDYTSKSVKGVAPGDDGLGPIGNFQWMPAISSNLSYIGARGFQKLYDTHLNFVYQLEAGIDISATPSTKQSNSNLSNAVNGALFSRNSFIGISSSEYGAIKVGKTDAPYKNSTAIFNPFNGEIGDYAVIMGNTGGDNRVEFGTRLAHAIWYESPNFSGFQFNALFAPGQNRSYFNDNVPAGEADCTGQNDPMSGAPPVSSCTDGSFGNAVSTNLSYTLGGFYATAAYERHFRVNRQGDIMGLYGATFPPLAFPAGTNGQLYFNQDVADEDAAKIGALYNFKATGTTVGGIFEHLHRYTPADLAFQNERSRDGTWLFLSQQITDLDSIHFGWAHAFRAQGDPGVHNDATVPAPDFAASGVTVAPNNNQADMVTAAYKRKLNDNLTWYTAVAATFNGPSAHYDLGAGGRGVTTDCHDASLPADGAGAGGHCFAGGTLAGVSTGLQFRF